jgi:nitroreductase
MLKAILNRRSVRSYRDDPVSDADIEEVLAAGFCAPSGHAASAWHVLVVRDQAIKDALAGVHQWSRIIARAPVAIVVCVDRSVADLWIEDGSAFMENMLIQATSMGLGTCWVAMRETEVDFVHATLGLPPDLAVLAATPLGYPARHPGPHEPAIPEGRVHFDRYSTLNTQHSKL